MNANERANALTRLLLEVAEQPTKYRVIVETNLPDLNNPWKDDCVYFMIDKSDGGGQPILDENGKCKEDENGRTLYEPAKVYDHWWVTDPFGNGAEFPKGSDVVGFFSRLFPHTETEAHVETF